MNEFFLADDLSGALDAAAAFHRSGQGVTVALSSPGWAVDAPGVIGLTTETRNLRPAAAAANVAAVLAEAQARRARLIYKKIDSTLRGPIAAELAALCAAQPGVRILFCPANPAVGRTVRGGVLYVRGVPVAETEFARDPACPVRVSSVRELLGGAATTRVWIADAETGADLAMAIERMETAGEPWVGVGSGALAKAFAARRAAAARTRTAPVPELPRTGPALFVCGSAHPLNRAQADALARETGWACHDVAIASPAAAAEDALGTLAARGGALLRLEAARSTSEEALRAIAMAASRVILRGGVTRLFVTGGETAFALGAALGLAHLQFAAEIEPGLSLSRGEAAGRAMSWAVKPGGFGDDETWRRAWRALQIGAATPAGVSVSAERRLPEP